MVLRTMPLIFIALLASSDAKAARKCGESFCLPKDASITDRQTPVEDFNLYRVERQGQQFRIYEGNHPDLGAAARTPLRLPLDPKANLAVRGGRGSVLLRIRKNGWPSFIEISGPCASERQCPVVDLARTVSRR